MKNSKVIFALLPVVLIVVLISISNIGFSSEMTTNSVSKVKDGTSTNCTWHITLSETEKGCLSGSYTYCVSGGSPVTVNGDFDLSLPCDANYTVCVKSSSGCIGTTFINNPCPCSGTQGRTIFLSPSTAECNCSGS